MHSLSLSLTQRAYITAAPVLECLSLPEGDQKAALRTFYIKCGMSEYTYIYIVSCDMHSVSLCYISAAPILRSAAHCLSWHPTFDFFTSNIGCQNIYIYCVMEYAQCLSLLHFGSAYSLECRSFIEIVDIKCKMSECSQVVHLVLIPYISAAPVLWSAAHSRRL